ncbi:MAG: hypothetical protein PHV85_09740 [Desulfovibrionaceae bacterium]|nr:hypothetical protein [Desulfovibrionaceae bacterium]
MIAKALRNILLLALTLLSAACAASEPRQPFGASVRMAVENQKLCPGPADDSPVLGLDGRYGQNVMDNYHNRPAANSPAKAPSMLPLLGNPGAK